MSGTMGHASRIILQYVNHGYDKGQVHVHIGNRDILVHSGASAKAVYDDLKDFVVQCRESSGEFYEQKTTSGFQWREKT
jgi:hypothetical protein